MNEDTEVEVQEERPRRGRRAKSEHDEEVTEQKLKSGIYFDLDKDTAVTIVCPYSRRREMAERLFMEHRGPDGLVLCVPACGTSRRFKGADDIPLSWNECGCRKHVWIRWMEGE